MASPVERIINGSSRVFGDDKERDRFLRRLRRAVKASLSQPTSGELMADALKIVTQYSDFPYSIETLAPLAETSVTAFHLLESAVCCERGRAALEDNDFCTAAAAFAQAYKKNSVVVRWDLPSMTQVDEEFKKLSKDDKLDLSLRADALLVRANLLFLSQDFTQGLRLLRLAQRLVPEDGDLHAIEGCALAMLVEKRKALKALTRASDLGCTEIKHTLFHRAVLLLSISEPIGDYQRAVTWLQEFVSRAEKDDRKLPEACYRLAMLHGVKGPQQLGAARRYCDLGLEADSHRLPIFPDEAAMHRRQALKLLKRYRVCGNGDCSVSAQKHCARCGQIYYCSRECQVQHWKSHKSDCKKSCQKQQIEG